ncbi:FAD-dependent monooxygenase [Zophobihabitans entericus]|uniref:NAD(P)-binding protein n=1 Tax=Zophobihabitans entericus TaxID=1635327 RepID=A0A6G9I7M0_9GAMM|nr:FAD-dependent monooxygenase [Zophobihabitans entericus]QIQ20208.1 NAD(P)-binding protein [Zophobihabitans entericus]
MTNFDVIIVGAGMVGLATAQALRDSHLRIAIIDPSSSLHDDLPPEPTLRASAINAASQRYFNELGIWNKLIQSGRVLSFDSIKVWETTGFAKLSAKSQDYQYPNLGYIIENKLIQNSLYESVIENPNCQLLPYRVKHIQTDNELSQVELDNGDKLSARLIIAADGAHSPIRTALQIPVVQRPYRHHAIIATIETELPHQNCARQIFYPEGIIAFLPLWQPNKHCLVWSVKPEEAERLSVLSPLQFEQTLSDSTGLTLGHCHLLSPLATFPLTARYARQFVKHRLALIGDAAHTIHPLAGQGVNLGLQDSRLLAKTIKRLQSSHLDIGLVPNLHQFESARKKDAIIMLAAMQSIQDMFNGNALWKKTIRGAGMNLINHFPLVKKTLIKQAMGL